MSTKGNMWNKEPKMADAYAFNPDRSKAPVYTKEEIDQYCDRAYDTVADMQADTTLTAGMICHTLGFYAAGDGGAAWYQVTDDAIANGMDIIALENGMYAVLQITESYVTPEMFGAYGDGVHDDHVVISYLLLEEFNIFLYKNYLITEPIIDGKDIKIKIFGNQVHNVWYGDISFNSCITVKDGVSVFKDSTVKGTIDGVSFVGENPNEQTSNTTEYVFDNCYLRNVNISNCFIFNFEAVFLNTEITSNSCIHDNNFLSCYYFAKRTKSDQKRFSDSSLTNNYINGGSKYNDNACFQWSSFNRSIIEGNFIDFYRSIYDPSCNGLYIFDHGFYIASKNNRYEAFRYFLNMPTNGAIKRIIASFTEDQFTHIDVIKASSFNLSRFEPYSVTVSDISYDIEPCLMHLYSLNYKEFNVVFENINLSVDAFTESAPFNATGASPFSANQLAKLKFTFQQYGNDSILIPNLIEQQTQPGLVTFYGDNDHFIETNYTKVLDSAPSLPSGYNQEFIPGCYYIYNNIMYKCIKYFQSIWKIGLIDNQGNMTYHQT